jgi:hypothetical protein
VRLAHASHRRASRLRRDRETGLLSTTFCHLARVIMPEVIVE